MAALLIERADGGAAEESSRDALRRYRFVLDAWPECLTAARGVRRLAEQLDDRNAVIEASIALGNLDGDPADRAERLMEAADALVAQNAPVQKVQGLLARALAEDPGSARAAHGLVSLIDRGAAVGPCVDALRLALERTPDPSQTIRLGTALAHIAFERLQDPTVALEALRRVRRKAPGHVPTLLALAETSAALNLFAEAAELATSATGITQDPDERVHASVILAEVHAQLPDMRTQARREVEAAEKLLEEDFSSARSSYLVRLARAYVCLSDGARAEEALVTAVLLGGSDPGPANGLARLYDIETSDGAKAYAAALSKVLARAEASKVAPDPGWLVALGRIEARFLEKPREGVARIREAIRIDPGRIEAYEALADVYGAMGAHEDSAAQLSALLADMDPRSATTERVTGLLDLLAREYGAAHRTLQAGAAEELSAYVRAKDVEGSVASRRHRLAPKAPVPLSLTQATISTALLPAAARGVFLETAALLNEVSLKVLRFDPTPLGLSPRDRLPPRSAHPLRMLADRVAMAFGDLRFDLQVEASVSAPRLLPGDPTAIVLPRGYGSISENEQAVGLARIMVYLALEIPWVEEVRVEDLDGLLLGAFRAGAEGWQGGMLAPARAANADVWRSRILRSAGRKLKRALEDAARRAKSNFDAKAWRQALRLGSFRAAYVLTGDLPSTLDHAFRVEQTLATVARGQAAGKMLENPVTRDLILYGMSSEPIGLRRSAGTA
jgi:tetratricopeptide (TPR) repeat protein